MKIPLGIEEGALYKRTETLLREYNSMQARVKNLKLDLENMAGTSATEEHQEAIEGLALGRSGLTGMPPPNSLSDKTASVALKWREEYRNNFHEIWKWFVRDTETTTEEVNAISRILQKIDNAILSLSEDEKIIIKGFYIDQSPWYDVAHEVQYVERHCKRLRTRAIWYMSKSIFGAGKVRN